YNSRISSQEVTTTAAIGATQARSSGTGPIISQILIFKKAASGTIASGTGVSHSFSSACAAAAALACGAGWSAFTALVRAIAAVVASGDGRSTTASPAM